MSNFGQIPTKLICRFGELSKREIIVLSFLYASRNRTSGVCNPSKKYIINQTNIAKQHVYPAIKNLVRLGWISEAEDGSFTLHENPKTVTKSVTAIDSEPEPETTGNSHQISDQKSNQIGDYLVTESVTDDETESNQISDSQSPNRLPKVTKSVTAYIRTEHSSNIEENIEESADDSEDPPQLSPPKIRKIPDTNHARLMEHHSKRIGAMLDGSKQAGFVKKILARFSEDQAKRCYDYLVLRKEESGYPARVDWSIVAGQIAEWVVDGEPRNPSELRKNSNGNQKSGYRTDRERKAVDDFDAIEQVRNRVAARNQQLPGSNAADRE